MKKIAALFIVTALLVSLAACALSPAVTTSQATTTQASTTQASTQQTTQATQATTQNPANPTPEMKESAKDALAAAIDKFYSHSSMHARLSADIVISTMGINTNMFLSSELCKNGGEWKNDSFYTALNESENNQVYFKDGAYYVSGRGCDAKILVSESANEKYKWEKSFEIFMEKLPSDLYVTYYKVNEDGSCEIKADTAQKTTMFKEFFEGMSESFAADEEGVTTSVGKPKESIHVFIDKNGNIEAYSAKITIEIAMQQNGKTEMLTIKTSSEVKADKIGGDVEVKAPEKSLDSFVLTTPEKLGYTFAKLAYDEFMKKPDVHASMEAYISVDMGVAGMEITLSGDLYANGLTGETPVVRQLAQIAIGYQKETVDMYFKDGYYYISNSEGKKKISKEEYIAEYGEEPDMDIITFFGENDFTNCEVSTAKNGETAFYFELDESKFPLVFADHITSMQELLAGTSAVTSMKISAPELMVTVSEEKGLSSYILAYVIEMTVESNGVNIPMTAYIYDLTVINSTSDVTVPEIPNIGSFTGSEENA
jgi:hypothetical protein